MNSTGILYKYGVQGVGSDDLFFSSTPFAKSAFSAAPVWWPSDSGTAENQIPDVGIPDYIADHFFKTNVGGLHCAGEGRAGFNAGTDQELDLGRDLVLVGFENDCHRDRRKIVTSQVAPRLAGIIRMRRAFSMLRPSKNENDQREFS